MRIIIALLVAVLGTWLPTMAQAQAGIPQPLGSTTLEAIIGNVVRGILGVSGALALIMFIWGGLQWMIAQGEADKIKKAKGTIVWAILGMVIIFSAYAIVSTLLKAL